MAGDRSKTRAAPARPGERSRGSAQPLRAGPACRNCSTSSFHRLHVHDEVLGVSEAARRNADVLLVRERDALAQGLVDSRGDRIDPHREVELLRHGAWDRHDGQLPFPGLTDPALLGEFLDVSRALPLRVAPRQKFSKKGWICKTWEGELAIVSIPGTMSEKFSFTVRDDSIAARVNQTMGKRVALVYHQHVGIPTSCFGETEYFVVDVKSVE